MTKEENWKALVRAVERNLSAPTHVRIDEMADGSGRWYAAFGPDEERMIVTPAPDDAPKWARERFPFWGHTSDYGTREEFILALTAEDARLLQGLIEVGDPNEEDSPHSAAAERFLASLHAHLSPERV